MPEIVGYDESKKLREICKACGAIIEFYPNEVKCQRFSTSDYDPNYYIICPGCKKRITLYGDNRKKAAYVI